MVGLLALGDYCLETLAHKSIEMPLATNNLPPLITRQELAKYFGRHVNTIDNWCKNGYLKPIYCGRGVYFRLDEIDFNNFPQRK